MKILWSPLAIERVTEIARYIAQDNLSAAEKWVQLIFDKVGLLVSTPTSGRIVPELNRREFRELLHGNYRIIYQVGKARVDILTVRHGKQMLPVDEILPGIDYRQ